MTLTKAELADLLFQKAIPISARRVVTFHPSAKLKSLIEKSYPGKARA